MSGSIWGTTKIISSGDMSADITATIDMKGARHLRLQLASAASGSRAGKIYVQESSDGSAFVSKILIDKSTGAPSSYLTVTTSTEVADSVDMETEAQYVRVFYDATSGSGTLNVWATVKE